MPAISTGCAPTDRHRSSSPARLRPEDALAIRPRVGEDVAAAASRESAAVLHSYVRLWAAQQALILMFTRLTRLTDQIQAFMVGLAFLCPAPLVSCAALATRIAANCAPFPFVWESHLWCVQTDVVAFLGFAYLGAHRLRNATAVDNAATAPAATSTRMKVGSAPGREPVVAAQSIAEVEPLSPRDIAAWIGDVIRWQLALFYSSAAFWKINSSFLDHRFSCSSIYVAQLLTGYQIYLQPILEPILRFVADGSVETGLASVDVLWAHVLRFAPHMTVMGEIAISVALLLAAACRSRGTVGRLAAKTGVSLALLLHLGIALTPPPNNVGAFSVIMATRLFFFCPVALAPFLAIPRNMSAAIDWAVGAAFAAALAMAAVSAAMSDDTSNLAKSSRKSTVMAQAADGDTSPTFNPADSSSIGQLGIMFFGGLDWSVPMFGAMMYFTLKALFCAGQQIEIGRARLPRSTLHAEARRNASSPLLASWRRQNGAMYGGPTTFPAGHPPRGLRYGGALLLLITGLHAFSGPLLGIQDVGSSNMFGNLRMHGVGSNHLIAPTALLQELDVLPASTWALARIENSSSEHINSHFPGEVSPVLSPASRALLRRAGHSGRQFNAAMGRVLSSAVLPQPSPTFVRYTIPMLELRRILSEAMSLGEQFQLEYTLLDPRGARVDTDEVWRASAEGRRFKIELLVNSSAPYGSDYDNVTHGSKRSATDPLKATSSATRTDGTEYAVRHLLCFASISISQQLAELNRVQGRGQERRDGPQEQVNPQAIKKTWTNVESKDPLEVVMDHEQTEARWATNEASVNTNSALWEPVECPPPLLWWEHLLGTWNPLPILDNPEGRHMHCFGP